MKQRTIKLDVNTPAAEFADALRSEPGYEGARARLVVIYYPAPKDVAVMQAFLDELGAALPGAHIVGMSSVGAINPAYNIETRIVCSLVLFESSSVHVASYSLAEQTQEEAADAFAASLADVQNLQGVLCMSSQVGLDPTAFLERAESKLGVPIFGTIAAMENMQSTATWVFADGAVYPCGVFGVAFSGPELQIRCDDNLGWKPVGRELEVTGAEPGGWLTEIEGEPALATYKKYLNVEPDEALLDNLCAFPFLIEGGDRYIVRTSLGSGPDGKLMLGIPIAAGTKIRLSYTKNDYLLGETLGSANAMTSFQPQALLLFPCLNRRIYLGNELADREFEYFDHANDQHCWGYGCGEILVTPTGGGVLNSSLVAVGMREGAASEAQGAEPLSDPELDKRDSKAVPLADRLATFLEAATADLEHLAQHDQLTGLFNRRRTDKVLELELQRRDREGELFLLMYDLDFFKHVNDTYGHSVGDSVLVELTECVREVLRGDDVLGRWGGEEFLCILRAPDMDQALAIAERVRAHVEEREFSTAGKLTVSIGVAQARPQDTADTLFNKADAALYEAKRAGRNCVRMGV